MIKKKPEVISLRKWLMSGKKHDYIVQCSGCDKTQRLTCLQDMFVCTHCGLDLRAYPSKVGRFTIWKQELVPVFNWDDPIQTVVKKKIRMKKVDENHGSQGGSKPKRKKRRKSFDEE